MIRDEVVKSKTDSEGIAVFKIHAVPAPRVLVVLLDDYICSAEEEFSTVKVLQYGIFSKLADDSHCRARTSSFPDAKPGELIIPAHRLNYFQQFWRDLD